MRLAVRDRQEEAEPEAAPHRFGGTDIFRGALVIVTALAVGGFVVSRGLDSSGSEVDTEAATPTTVEPVTTEPDPDLTLDETADTADPLDDSSASTSIGQLGGSGDATVTDAATGTTSLDGGTGQTVTDETAMEEPPPTTIPLRSPAEVKVLVLNGGQTQGIAARGTEHLQASGYQTAAPKNATNQRPDSIIFYTEGYQNEATAVAQLFGPGLEALVTPLDPAVPPIDDLQDANVVVVIGGDNAIPIP